MTNSTETSSPHSRSGSVNRYIQPTHGGNILKIKPWTQKAEFTSISHIQSTEQTQSVRDRRQQTSFKCHKHQVGSSQKNKKQCEASRLG